MRIIKNGFEREFTCKKCSSIFIADKNEYKAGSIYTNGERKKCIYSECPVCHKMTYMIPENEEGGLFNGN